MILRLQVNLEVDTLSAWRDAGESGLVIVDLPFVYTSLMKQRITQFSKAFKE